MAYYGVTDVKSDLGAFSGYSKGIGADSGMFSGGLSKGVMPDVHSKAPAMYYGGKIDKIDNRGSLRPHWLRVSLPYYKRHELLDLCKKWFGEYEEINWGRWRYQRMMKFASGVTFLHDLNKMESIRRHSGMDCLDVPGGVLDCMEISDIEKFYSLLFAMGARGTRVDCAFDDYCRSVSPQEVFSRSMSGELVGFRLVTPKLQYKLVRGGSKVIHDEVNFGRRGNDGSGKYLRVYDKFIESGQGMNAYRWEIEYTQDYANQAFVKLASCSGDLAKFVSVIGGLIAGAVDFKDPRGGETHLSRRARSKWWGVIREKLLDDIRLRKSVVKSTLESMEKGIDRQYAPAIAVLVLSKGREYVDSMIDGMIDSGLRRFNSKHRALVNEQVALDSMYCHLRKDRSGITSVEIDTWEGVPLPF